MGNLKIATEFCGPHQEITLVLVDGVLDTLTSPELEKVLNSLMSQRRYKIVVDLEKVSYISSAGWGIFVSHLKDLREKDGDLKLTRMSPQVMEIYELLEFDTILKAFDDLNKAKLDFGLKLDYLTENLDVKASSSKISPENSPAALQKLVVFPETNINDSLNWENCVLKFIQADPLLSIFQLKRKLTQKKLKVSLWRIVKFLKKKRLLRPRNRFRWAWKHKN